MFFGREEQKPDGDTPHGTLIRQAVERFSGHAADKVGL